MKGFTYSLRRRAITAKDFKAFGENAHLLAHSAQIAAPFAHNVDAQQKRGRIVSHAFGAKLSKASDIPLRGLV